jgi:hypothetical protein
MIWVALGLSGVLLAVTNVIALRSLNLGRASLLAWIFAAFGLVPFVLPGFLVHATLLALVGTCCVVAGLGAKIFVKGSVLATLAAYGAIGVASIWSVGRDGSVADYWHAAERMHDKSIVDITGWPHGSAPAQPDLASQSQEPSPFLQEIHHHTFESFASVYDFGMSRMLRLERMHHRAPVLTSLPEKDEAPPQEELIVGAGQTVPLQKDYTDPQGQCWELTRVQLIGLLKYEEPVVYRTNELQLPQMRPAALDKVLTRTLDEWESSRLEELKKGKELAVEGTPKSVRMLGAVRAGQQCQKCHQVNQGDLLGAFTYELHRK